MKKYIKPEINALELETLPAIAAGSPNVSGDGKQVTFGENGGHAGTSTSRVKRKEFGSLWEEPTDDEEEEDF